MTWGEPVIGEPIPGSSAREPRWLNPPGPVMRVVHEGRERLGREGAKDKGRRLLVEGRLTVLRVGLEIHARCRGDSAQVYELGWARAGGWYCSCPAQGTCSHLVALMLVVLRP